jgi:septum formation protein
LGVDFTVRATDVEEIEQGPDAGAVALENALRKARAARRPGTREAILACDTIVVLDGTIYGKPADAEAARTTVGALAGRTHEVISGLAVLVGEQTRTAVARTRVSFRALSDEELDAYVATGEWRGRSGGYAIQGAGAALATEIDGEIENVVGLPLSTLLELCPEIARG